MFQQIKHQQQQQITDLSPTYEEESACFFLFIAKQATPLMTCKISRYIDNQYT